MIRRSLAPSILLLAGAAALIGQAESPVVGVGPFMHIVADLDQSLAFYHGQLGLELRDPGADHKFTDNPAVAKLYGVPGKQFRAAVLKIPGSEMGIELVQWGEARKPEDKLVTQSGIAMLMLRLRGGGEDGVSVVDPDGFPVTLGPSNVSSAALRVSVSDPRKTAALYQRLLGLHADRILFTTTGAHEGGGGSFPEPGQAMLRLFVRNIDTLTASMKGAGFSVITTGGAPVTLPQGPRVIILRDPNNFYLQLMEMR